LSQKPYILEENPLLFSLPQKPPFSPDKTFKRYELLVRRHLTVRNFFLGISFLILFFLYKNVVKGIFLAITFIPLAVVTIRASRFIPHVNIESVTASSLLLAYLYGPNLASIFALVAGMYGLFKANFIRFLLIVNWIHLIMTLYLMSLLKGLSFDMYFIIGILLKNLISFLILLVLDPDQIQNITHRITHTIWNLAIARLLFLVIYDLFRML